jgi:ankyrin repeat protein
MSLPPLPQDDNPIITQFKPVKSQWELNEVNINRIDPENGHTILHNYCRSISTTPLEVYQYLIETKGCDINAQDDDNDTPIRYAFDRFRSNDGGDIAVLAYLINQKNLDVNTKGQYGYTLLHWACNRINQLPLDVFKLLIENAGCDIHAQDNKQNTPLHIALLTFYPGHGGDITVLTYLLTRENVNANIRGDDGDTLLYIACNNINILPLEIFKYLIETKGFDINIQNVRFDTPVHNALRSFNPKSNIDGVDINVLHYLLGQIGANVNHPGFFDTLLCSACDNINQLPLGIFKYLIETLDCDFNALDYYNCIALHTALHHFKPVYGGDTNVLNYLFSQKNVNVNIKDSNGCNLLHLACTCHPFYLDIFLSSDDVAKLDAECDTILCHIVEAIAERCVQQVFDETNLE